MPWSALKPCAAPGCAKAVKRTERYCEPHRVSKGRERRTDPVKRKQLAFYCQPPGVSAVPLISQNTLYAYMYARWLIVQATVVDHRVGAQTGGDDFAWSNLQAICHRCHSVKTRHDGGAW